MSRIGGAIRDTMSVENDAPRVNVWERGRPSFLVLLNARDPTPGHSYLRLLRRKCLLPSAPRVRLRTLNRTSYESRNAMTNVPTAARAASALRNFSILGPPIESSAAAHGMRRKGILLRALALTAGKRNICKHLFANHTLDHTSDGGWLRYPKKRGRLQRGVCPEKRMAKQERGWTRKVSASLMAITSHLPRGWVNERYSCSDSSACLRLRMRCATPMHSTAPPAIQVKVTPLRPVSGRLEPSGR